MFLLWYVASNHPFLGLNRDYGGVMKVNQLSQGWKMKPLPANQTTIGVRGTMNSSSTLKYCQGWLVNPSQLQCFALVLPPLHLPLLPPLRLPLLPLHLPPHHLQLPPLLLPQHHFPPLPLLLLQPLPLPHLQLFPLHLSQHQSQRLHPHHLQHHLQYLPPRQLCVQLIGAIYVTDGVEEDVEMGVEAQLLGQNKTAMILKIQDSQLLREEIGEEGDQISTRTQRTTAKQEVPLCRKEAWNRCLW
mmetsp:Transcript_29722/g.49257  ORF Transcript_29722/g.49257 Transcript_29722/m.49257 type:complete len:244 (+) Transcript_29722:2943-3674(+)